MIGAKVLLAKTGVPTKQLRFFQRQKQQGSPWVVPTAAPATIRLAKAKLNNKLFIQPRLPLSASKPRNFSLPPTDRTHLGMQSVFSFPLSKSYKLFGFHIH